MVSGGHEKEFFRVLVGYRRENFVTGAGGNNAARATNNVFTGRILCNTLTHFFGTAERDKPARFSGKLHRRKHFVQFSP
jgi:hypothetical protein